MKNKLLKKLLYILTVAVIVALVGAGIYAYSVLNHTQVITLGVSQTYTLTPRESDYIVRSYHAGVVTPVSGSTVKATSIGEAVVCLRYTYFDRDFYRFNVISEPDNLTISKTQLTLGVSESYTLDATSTVGNFEFDATFTSSDPDVATVTSDGVISAVSEGSCNITASTYNSQKATCKLTVKRAATSITLNETQVIMGESETFVLTPTFTDGEYSSQVVFSSSDPDVARVESDGTVTALKVGECTLTASTFNNVSKDCIVTVKKMPQALSLVVLDKYNTGTSFTVLTNIESDCAAYDIRLSVSDDSVIAPDSENPFLMHCKKQGECTLTATLQNSVSVSETITVGEYKKSNISFKILNQFPTLPTGCEVVSLTSVLNHYGYNVSMTEMADKYMPTKKYDYFLVSPHNYFLGTPYTWDGMGCFSGCIIKTANNYFNDNNIDDYVAVDISGCTPDELYNYLCNGVPVITWCTSGFVTPTDDGTWTAENDTITWCNHEHCLVTTGFDKSAGTVTVADNSGGYSYSVSMSQYEKVFTGMGSMAVVILKK